MIRLEQAAREFATNAHASMGQVRKYTGEPYINHPAAVVELVRSVPHSKIMLCAAWLHDTMEDCGVEFDLGGQCIDNGMSALKASARLYLTLLAEHS